MIKKHLLSIALAAATSTALATLTEDTIDIFEPDTVVAAGDYTLSCETYEYSDHSEPASWIGTSIFELTDSIGRSISYSRTTVTSKQGASNGDESNLYLDTQGRVAMHVKTTFEKGPGFAKTYRDTLIGSRWNSSGMITSGDLIHHYRAGANGQGSESIDTTFIHLTYDSDSITSIDTMVETDSFNPDTVIYAGMYELSVEIDTREEDTTDAPWSSKKYYTYTDSIGRVVEYNNFSGTFNGPGSGGGVFKRLILDTAGQTVCSEQIKRSYNPQTESIDSIYIFGKEWNEQGMITFGAQLFRHTMTGIPDPIDSIDTTFFYITYEDDGVTIKETQQEPYGYYTDTLYPAGDIAVPCIYENYLPPLYRGPGISKIDEAFKDVHGRYIFKREAFSDAIGRYNSHDVIKTELDSLSRMKNEYRSQYSGGQGGFGRKEQTLFGTVWNEKGMITGGLLVLDNSDSNGPPHSDTVWIALTYDSTGLVSTDTLFYNDSLVADTVILAHHTPVPAWKTSIDNSSETDTGTIHEYRDELGRLVYHQELTINTINGVWEMCTTTVHIDSTNKVRLSRNSFYGGTGAGNLAIVKTLNGYEWNSKGLITVGELTTDTRKGHLKGGTASSVIQKIELLYDSTDLIVIDTLFLDEVTVIEQAAVQQNGVSIRRMDKNVTLTGLQGGTVVNLYMANGRLLSTVYSDTKGVAHLNLSTVPSGIYFVHTKERTFKISNR